MKVVAFNGSPKVNGNTFLCLETVCKTLQAQGIETEIVQVGSTPVHGCMACGACAKNADLKCVIDTDILNKCVLKAKEADGILLGSPVYYAGINGTMKCFLDRLFYVAGSNGGFMRHKVGGAVAAVRRSGGMTTFNSLNHYFLISEMLVPGSNYWNVSHGAAPGETTKDAEGQQIMEVLGKNMAWLLKMKAQAPVSAPERTQKTFTNFIR
jgi:multimeric flavodoxin WrbA